MLPETILIPNAVCDPFGHKDSTNRGVSMPKSEQLISSYSQERHTLHQDPWRQLECLVARYHRSSPKHVLSPSLHPPVRSQAPRGKPDDSRPIPHMTSSRINNAPYFLQTDFIALKYPLGAASAPVVAPTTVSATTFFTRVNTPLQGYENAYTL
jgi:hypothetical protein